MQAAGCRRGLAGKIVAMALGGQETSLVTAQLLCVLSRLCDADTAGFLSLLLAGWMLEARET